MQPPDSLDGARVLMTADLTSASATGGTRHYGDGQLQEAPERLALAQYDDVSDVYLFYCDASWNVLNDTRHDDIASAERQAASEFTGVVFVAA